MEKGAVTSAMQRSGWIDYEERFDAVVTHVAEHLDEPLDLIRLAEVAGLSPKHWHRVFTAAYGETLASFVKRLRLQRAAFALANTDAPIAEVAQTCGYPNVASFTRVFTSAFGMPPGRYRKIGSHAPFRRASMNLDPHAFSVDIRHTPEIECFAVAHRGPYIRIDEAFRDLEAWYAAHGMAVEDQELFGVFFSDPSRTPEKDLRSLACYRRPPEFVGPLNPLSPGAADLQPFTLGGGIYAVLPHHGAYADMPAKYDWLFGCWVPDGGYALADRPVIERYVDLPRDAAPDHLLTEMWLPLEVPARAREEQ